MSCNYTVSSLDLPKPYIPLKASLALELFPLANLKNVIILVLGFGRSVVIIVVVVKGSTTHSAV